MSNGHTGGQAGPRPGLTGRERSLCGQERIIGYQGPQGCIQGWTEQMGAKTHIGAAANRKDEFSGLHQETPFGDSRSSASRRTTTTLSWAQIKRRKAKGRRALRAQGAEQRKAKGREVPYDAKCQTTRIAEVRELPHVA